MDDKEFKCLALKALRTLVRSIVLHNPLFWKRESNVWDWHKEMQEVEEKLIKAEKECG